MITRRKRMNRGKRGYPWSSLKEFQNWQVQQKKRIQQRKLEGVNSGVGRKQGAKNHRVHKKLQGSRRRYNQQYHILLEGQDERIKVATWKPLVTLRRDGSVECRQKPDLKGLRKYKVWHKKKPLPPAKQTKIRWVGTKEGYSYFWHFEHVLTWSRWFGRVGEINDAGETRDDQRNTIFEKAKEDRTKASEKLTFNRKEIFSPLQYKGRRKSFLMQVDL